MAATPTRHSTATTQSHTRACGDAQGKLIAVSPGLSPHHGTSPRIPGGISPPGETLQPPLLTLYRITIYNISRYELLTKTCSDGFY